MQAFRHKLTHKSQQAYLVHCAGIVIFVKFNIEYTHYWLKLVHYNAKIEFKVQCHFTDVQFDWRQVNS